MLDRYRHCSTYLIIFTKEATESFSYYSWLLGTGRHEAERAAVLQPAHSSVAPVKYLINPEGNKGITLKLGKLRGQFIGPKLYHWSCSASWTQVSVAHLSALMRKRNEKSRAKPMTQMSPPRQHLQIWMGEEDRFGVAYFPEAQPTLLLSHQHTK